MQWFLLLSVFGILIAILVIFVTYTVFTTPNEGNSILSAMLVALLTLFHLAVGFVALALAIAQRRTDPAAIQRAAERESVRQSRAAVAGTVDRTNILAILGFVFAPGLIAGIVVAIIALSR